MSIFCSRGVKDSTAGSGPVGEGSNPSGSTKTNYGFAVRLLICLIENC